MKGFLFIAGVNALTLGLTFFSYVILKGAWWTLIPIPFAIVGIGLYIIGFLKEKNSGV